MGGVVGEPVVVDQTTSQERDSEGRPVEPGQGGAGKEAPTVGECKERLLEGATAQGVGLVSLVLGSKASSRQAWSCGLVAHQGEGWRVEYRLLN